MSTQAYPDHRFSNEKARSRLGWSPRPVEDTVVDTAHSLIREGVVEAKP